MNKTILIYLIGFGAAILFGLLVGSVLAPYVPIWITLPLAFVIGYGIGFLCNYVTNKNV